MQQWSVRPLFDLPSAAMDIDQLDEERQRNFYDSVRETIVSRFVRSSADIKFIRVCDFFLWLPDMPSRCIVALFGIVCHRRSLQKAAHQRGMLCRYAIRLTAVKRPSSSIKETQ